jgi:hypothetical protein
MSPRVNGLSDLAQGSSSTLQISPARNQLREKQMIADHAQLRRRLMVLAARAAVAGDLQTPGSG